MDAKISCLEPVFKLYQLTSLSVFDFSKRNRLDGIGALADFCMAPYSNAHKALRRTCKRFSRWRSSSWRMRLLICFPSVQTSPL